MLKFVLMILFVITVIQPVQATYSIIACDRSTRECGVAVQTNNLAVGASVPTAQAGIAAFVSQFETNPMYGPRVLELRKRGMGVQQILAQLLKEDGNFDGQGIEARQIAIVTVDGSVASYTGTLAQQANWAGVRSGDGYSVQGNGLAGPQVLTEMESAFLNTSGTLAERLLAALLAGDAAGGQTTGKQSAALLVRTPAGFPLDIDLRIDSSTDPVHHLQSLFRMHNSRQQVIQARSAVRKGDFSSARNLLIDAVAQAPSWPRLWLQAARVAVEIEEPALALQYLTMAFKQNSAWAGTEIGAGDYALLGRYPLFAIWVTKAQKEDALTAYRATTQDQSTESCLRTARILLEAGQPAQSLSLMQRLGSAANIDYLRAEAFFAQGEYEKAVEYAQKAVQREPSVIKYRIQFARLQASRISNQLAK